MWRIYRSWVTFYMDAFDYRHKILELLIEITLIWLLPPTGPGILVVIDVVGTYT
jgi:hypothetical protein